MNMLQFWLWSTIITMICCFEGSPLASFISFRLYPVLRSNFICMPCFSLIVLSLATLFYTQFIIMSCSLLSQTWLFMSEFLVCFLSLFLKSGRFLPLMPLFCYSCSTFSISFSLVPTSLAAPTFTIIVSHFFVSRI